PLDAVLVVVLLDDRRHRSSGANAVAAHHDGFLLPVLVEKPRAEPLRVERAELEDVAELDRRLLEERAAADDAGITRVRLPDVGEARFVVPSGLNALQVPAVAVRTGHELTFAQGLVGY